MEQRIKVDENGCLVVTTDNGIIKKGETTTEIKGVFHADAETVAKLLGIVNGENAISMCRWGESWLLLSNEKLSNTIKDSQNNVEKTKKEYEIRESEFVAILQETLYDYYKHKYPKQEVSVFALNFGDIREKVKFVMRDLLNENKELANNVSKPHQKIEKFNASRRPWERKFNLE